MSVRAPLFTVSKLMSHSDISMTHKKTASTKFSDFYNDDANISPAERAKIDFEVALIGKLIEAREAKGLTQAQLAKVSGLTQSAIARLETMKATPQIDTLFKVLTPMGYKLAIVPDDPRQ